MHAVYTLPMHVQRFTDRLEPIFSHALLSKCFFLFEYMLHIWNLERFPGGRGVMEVTGYRCGNSFQLKLGSLRGAGWVDVIPGRQAGVRHDLKELKARMMRITAEKTNVQRLPEVRIIEYGTTIQRKERSESRKCQWMTDQDTSHLQFVSLTWTTRYQTKCEALSRNAVARTWRGAVD